MRRPLAHPPGFDEKISPRLHLPAGQAANQHPSILSHLRWQQLDRTAGLGKQQLRPEEGSEFLDDLVPVPVNFAPKRIGIEPNDVNRVTRHLARHRAPIGRCLDV